MPRLGTDDDAHRNTNNTNRQRPPHIPVGSNNMATAYAANNHEPFSRLTGILFILAITFILKNVLFHDYRMEVMETLKATGEFSVAEMDRIVPRTATERQQYALDETNDVQKMKHDIAYLLQAVQEVKEQLNGTNNTNNTKRHNNNNNQS